MGSERNDSDSRAVGDTPEPKMTDADRGAPELLPCPFCGGPGAALVYDCEWSVVCAADACRVSVGRMFDSEASAIAEWNRRVAAPGALPPQSEIDAWRKRTTEAETALRRAIELLLDVEPMIGERWNLVYNDVRVFLQTMEREYASFGFSYPQSGPVIAGMKKVALGGALPPSTTLPLIGPLTAALFWMEKVIADCKGWIAAPDVEHLTEAIRAELGMPSWDGRTTIAALGSPSSAPPSRIPTEPSEVGDSGTPEQTIAGSVQPPAADKRSSPTSIGASVLRAEPSEAAIEAAREMTTVSDEHIRAIGKRLYAVDGQPAPALPPSTTLPENVSRALAELHRRWPARMVAEFEPTMQLFRDGTVPLAKSPDWYLAVELGLALGSPSSAPPSRTDAKCADCGAALNALEAKCFTVCDECWDKHYANHRSGRQQEGDT